MQIDSVIIRHSPIILLYRMILITISIGLLYGIYIFAQANIGGVSLIDNAIHPIALFLFTICIEMVAMIITFLQWAYTTFEFKSSELIFQKGVLRKQRKIHSLANVQSVEVEQGCMGILFHYGDIQLYNPLLRAEIIMKNVTDPEKYAHALRNAIDGEKVKIVPTTTLQSVKD